MRGHELRREVRSSVRAYEQGLDPVQRKQLGQFFTGVPIGKLLAHLALRPSTRTVLDPMVGHGDLLDATWEAAVERANSIARLDGIEIDKSTADTCRDRLVALIPAEFGPAYSILAANAFDPATLDALPIPTYDLVITNPPYVRYQTRNGNIAATALARAGLEQIIERSDIGADGAVWKTLAQSYSGLADLSVPAWILAGSLVRPGGRLALVVPATWRTRDYAHVIRYLLLRCFALETVVADTQPGWFSDALVRTHLIIARRLSAAEARQCLSKRDHWPEARWLQVRPDAADERSLVGAAFKGKHPEADFADWVHANAADSPHGIDVRVFDLQHEWATLHARINKQRWYPILERSRHDLTLFAASQKPAAPAIPEALRDMLPSTADSAKLVSLEHTGIKVGQGLRTGCNRFFYVTACGTAQDGCEQVNASRALGGVVFAVPASALHPVLRRQAEIRFVERGEVPPGRVLDLHAWVLPEDTGIVSDARAAYEHHRANPPSVMPADLATFVRHAATISLDKTADDKLIPELSAVRTNVRRPGRTGVVPRFWYMLPDFAPRHLPAAFAPRVNQRSPWIECNTDPPLLIDANFSTFWAADGGWTRFAMKALLNSVWCRAFMEAVGTPLGGGALKLEATHLRRMFVPAISNTARGALDVAGRNLARDSQGVQARIDCVVLKALLPATMSEASLLKLAGRMAVQTTALCAARQRAASLHAITHKSENRSDAF